MNGLLIVLIGVLVLGAGYLFYGRWLARKWGLNEKAHTPAVRYEDGEDYVPASKFTVFSHQFSSIAGAGPVTGPILASVFGWVPVLLWLLIGGLFFGAVQDFGALYASVKNDGKSMGMIIEKYIGKMGRKLFMLFCWLFTLLVIAAFTDMVAGTFDAYPAEIATATTADAPAGTVAATPVAEGTQAGTDAATPAAEGTQARTAAAVLDPVYANGAAASVSMLFILVAVILGLILKRVTRINEVVKGLMAIVLIIAMFAVGMYFPLYADKTVWIYVIMGYLFLASILPMWLLMQPRDYMTTYMLLGMILGAVVGVLAAQPEMKLNAFNGFTLVAADGSRSYLFPALFVTIACGAVSGFHSLVSSGTSSKTVSNEKDMPMVGYGAMVVETLLAIIALVVVGAVAVNGTKPEGTPFSIFASGVAGFLTMLGVPLSVATVFMTMCVSALALTSLDSVARIGRMSFQELFYEDITDPAKMSGIRKLLTNKYFSTVVTLFFGWLLCLGGYNNVWPLFGSANQLLAALVLIALAVFFKTTGRTGWTLYIPMAAMLVVTFTALIQKIIFLIGNVVNGNAVFLVDGLQLIIAVLLMVLGILVAASCFQKLFGNFFRKTE